MKWRIQITVFHLPLTIFILVAISEGTTACQVQVSEPWPAARYLYVPRDSIIEMNCTALDGTKSPIWGIDIANDEDPIQLQFGSRSEDLNAHGLFEIEESGVPATTGRLLINNTAVNNQTVINCDRRAPHALATTTLFVFNPSTIVSLDAGVNMIRLEWCQESLVPGTMQSFSLTVSHRSSSQDISGLNESYYHFSAPEGAPPCEVYSFSITATYVGAIYTGVGCSVPSPVLSTMLPSLPNVSQLESSLDLVLEKRSTDFVIEVSFEPASYCKNYPVMNYTLEVNSSLNREILASELEPNANNFTLGGNLSNENTRYTFRVLVANSVGTIPTSYRQIYTTDVQVVKVKHHEGTSASTIQCEFVTGSNATGCMVVLTGFVPYHINLTRNPSTNLTSSTVILERPLSCYTGVEAFDIESDGSVGSLAVSGQLGSGLETPCTPIHTLPIKPKTTEPFPTTFIVVIVIIIIVMVVTVVIILVAIFIRLMRKSKRSQVGTTDTYSKFGCPASLCCSQSSADGDERHQIQLQSVKPVMDKNKQDKNKHPLPDHNIVIMHVNVEDKPIDITSAAGGIESVCIGTDTSANDHPREVATTAKGESLYSEVVPSNKRKKRANTISADVKADNAYSEPKGAPTKGYTSLLYTGEQEEALYDQPIPMKVKIPRDRADDNRNDPSTNCEGTHATQNTHLYFTLEPGRATGRVNSTPISSQAPSNVSVPPQPASNECPPPIYQEITDLKIRGKATASTVNGIPNTPLPSSSPPLIQRPLSVPAADSDTQNPVG